MTVERIFGGKCHCCSISTVVFLFIGLFCELVISAYYYNKTNPWIKHGTSAAMIGCYTSVVCVVFSLLSLIMLTLLIITYCFCQKCKKNVCICILINVFLILFTAITVITGTITSIPGLSIPWNEYEQNVFEKCYDYYFDNILEARAYALEHNQIDSFLDWFIDFLYLIVKFGDGKIDKKEYKNSEVHMNSWKLASATDTTFLLAITTFLGMYGDGNAGLNSTLCVKYAAPELIFAIWTAIAFIIYLSNLCCACCCGKPKDDSDQEDQAKNSSSNL